MAVLADAPIEQMCVEARVLRISFDAPCRYCQHRATMNVRPVDAIGSPMVADLYACTAHTDELVTRARVKGIEVSMWPP